MNEEAASSTEKPPIKPSSAHASDPDARPQDFKGLDRATERIRRANLPPAPYIVSIDGGPICSGRGDQWTFNSPFAPSEGHLQHQTLLYRDTTTCLLNLRAPHEDEEWRRLSAMRANGTVANKPDARSGAATPLNASTAKKKLSLSAYKSRLEAGSQASTPVAQPQAGDLRKEILKKELGSTAELKASGLGEDAHDAGPSPLVDPSPNFTHQEGSRDVTSTARLPDDATTSDLETSRPAKRLRSTPPVEDHITVQPLNSTSLTGPKTAVRGEGDGSGINKTHKSETSKRSEPADVPSLAVGAEREPSPEQKGHTPLITVSSASPIGAPMNRSRGEEKPQTSKDGHSPEPPKRSHVTEDPSSGKSQSDSGSREDTDKTNAFQAAKEKGLSSWLPKNATHVKDDRGSWVPARSTSTIQARSPPPLSSLNDKSSTWLPASSSNAESTSKSRPAQSVGPTDKIKSPPSPASSADETPLLSPNKARGSMISPKNSRDSKPPVQATKGTSKPSQPLEPVNGMHKAPKMVKVSGGNSAFFKNLDSNTKTTSSRPPAPTTLPQTVEEPLIVKLKYGRSRARDVERILRLKPTPRKEFFTNSGVTRSPPSPRYPTVSHEQDKTASHEGKSRKRSLKDDDDHRQPAEKRQKVSEHSDPKSPHTPHAKRHLSPAGVTPAKVGSQQSPSSARELKSGNQLADTPQGASLSPQSSGSVNRRTSGALAAPETSQDASSRTWKPAYDKHLELGKTLKRKMQATIKSLNDSDSKDGETRKAAAVDGVESVLCFMNAFATQDLNVRDKKRSMQNWESILPWTGEVWRTCRPFQHLQGMALVLNSVCSSELATAYSRANLAESSAGSPPESSTMLKKVLDNFGSMQWCASESERLLPRATLAQRYPGTYEECLLLPFWTGMKSKAAVRVGARFLREWTGKEKIGWTQQLDESILA